MQAVRSLLFRAFEHIMKAHGWPHGPVSRWKRETRAFLSDANRRINPSMRGGLDLPDLYERARFLVVADDLDGQPPRPLPEMCPFAVEDLIVSGKAPPDVDALIAKITAPP